MRLPRDLGGERLDALLGRYGYQVTGQTGSHMRLTTTQRGAHHITIPCHKSLRVGTLSAILRDAAEHLGIVGVGLQVGGLIFGLAPGQAARGQSTMDAELAPGSAIRLRAEKGG